MMSIIIGCFYEHTHSHNKGLGREYLGHAKFRFLERTRNKKIRFGPRSDVLFLLIFTERTFIRESSWNIIQLCYFVSANNERSVEVVTQQFYEGDEVVEILVAVCDTSSHMLYLLS